MKWKPAQSKDQHQAEDRFSYFSTLQREIGHKSSPGYYHKTRWFLYRIQKVCVFTCLRCSLSANLRLPFWCLSISQVIRPQKTAEQARGTQKQNPNSHQSFASLQNWNMEKHTFILFSRRENSIPVQIYLFLTSLEHFCRKVRIYNHLKALQDS